MIQVRMTFQEKIHEYIDATLSGEYAYRFFIFVRTGIPSTSQWNRIPAKIIEEISPSVSFIPVLSVDNDTFECDLNEWNNSQLEELKRKITKKLADETRKSSMN